MPTQQYIVRPKRSGRFKWQKERIGKISNTQKCNYMIFINCIRLRYNLLQTDCSRDIISTIIRETIREATLAKIESVKKNVKKCRKV